MSSEKTAITDVTEKPEDSDLAMIPLMIVGLPILALFLIVRGIGLRVAAYFGAVL